MRPDVCKNCEFYRPVSGRRFGKCVITKDLWGEGTEALIFCKIWIPTITEEGLDMKNMIPYTEEGEKTLRKHRPIMPKLLNHDWRDFPVEP